MRSVHAIVVAVCLASPSILAAGDAGDGAILERLNRIVFPQIRLEQVSVGEALEFIRLRALELDPDPDPSMRGVSILLVRPAAAGGREPQGGKIPGGVRNLPPISYAAGHVALPDLLVAIARRAGLDLHLTSRGLVLCPPGVSPLPDGAEGDRHRILRTLYQAP